MATNFPSSVDALTNPVAGDGLNSPSHSSQHANANDAIEAIEGYLLTGAGANDYAKIIPSGATNGTVAANGTVTVTASSSSVTVSGVFSSTYDVYKIIFTGKSSTYADLRFTLGGITTGYYGSQIYSFSTIPDVQTANDSNIAYWDASIIGSGGFTTEIDLFGANAASQKIARVNWVEYQTTDVALSAGGNSSLWSTSTSSATAFTCTAATGNFASGSIQVYGLKK